MNNIGLWIYLSDVVKNISVTFTIITLCLFVGLLIIFIFTSMLFVNDDLDEKTASRLGKVLRWIFISLIIVAPINCAIPSQKTIAAMIVVPAIVNNEEIAGITKDSLKGLRILAEEWAKELASDTKEKE